MGAVASGGPAGFSFDENLRYWRTVVRGRLGMAAALAIVLSFSLAFLGFAYLSNLLSSEATDMSIAIDEWNVIGFDIYFLVAFFSGIGFVSGVHKLVLRHRSAVLALMVVPGLVVLFTGMAVYLLPFIRGLLAVMPLLGLSLGIFSLAEWPYSGVGLADLARLRRVALIMVVWAIAMAGAFDVGAFSGRWLGAAVVYPGIVLAGIILAAEALRARDALDEVMRLVERGVPGRDLPWEMSGAGDPAAPVRHVAGLSRRQTAFLAVFILAMVPCIVSLSSPPRLDIVYAFGGGEGVDVTIVNRGGQAAEHVELWGDGELVATIGRIDGFGVWEATGLKGTPHHLVVRVGASDADSRDVYYPPPCGIIWAAIGIVAAYRIIPRVRRARR